MELVQFSKDQKEETKKAEKIFQKIQHNKDDSLEKYFKFLFSKISIYISKYKNASFHQWKRT